MFAMKLWFMLHLFVRKQTEIHCWGHQQASNEIYDGAENDLNLRMEGTHKINGHDECWSLAAATKW